MTIPHQPQGAIHLASYQQLEQFVRAFAAGQINLLFLIGPPGVQKSRIVRAALGPQAAWIEGNVTPFGLYRELYRQRDELIVLDDVDDLYRDRAALRLLKCLCQTEPVKQVAWHSDAVTLRREEIPRSFQTRSRLVIIANELRTSNVNVQAVQDRGLVVLFEPSPLEIHLRAATWFWDSRVFNFIGENLQLAQRLSLRDYTLSWEMKQAGLDWRHWLLAKWGLSGSRLLVARLKADTSFQNEAQRVQAFITQGGGCRATYYNLAKKLHHAKAPKIQLTCSPPESTPQIISLLELLRQRYKSLGQG
jgi:hypothetical protein